MPCGIQACLTPTFQLRRESFSGSFQSEPMKAPSQLQYHRYQEYQTHQQAHRQLRKLGAPARYFWKMGQTKSLS